VHIPSVAIKVARRPWAPRTFLEFAIKTGYALDPWKTFCCPWMFSGVLESCWTVVKLFSNELSVTLIIQKPRLNNVFEQRKVSICWSQTTLLVKKAIQEQLRQHYTCIITIS